MSEDFDEAVGKESGGQGESRAECGAVDLQKANSKPNKVQNAVQQESAGLSIKQNPAGTYAKSCGAALGEIRLARRRGGDSNPRYLAVRRFSRPVHSATLPPLRGSRGLCGADCREFSDYVNHSFLIVITPVWFVI